MAQGINARQVKIHNEAVVLDLVRRYQPISRYEIAQLSGLTPATISSVVARLLPLGVVREGASVAPRGEDRGGRRRIPISLIPSSRLAGGILINRTGAEGVVVDLGGHIHAEVRHEWPQNLFECSLEDVANFIEEIRQRMLADLPSSLQSNVVGYGVAVPSLVPPEWSWSHVLVGLEDPVKNMIVWSNNAVASAYGEWWTGMLPAKRSMLHLFLGGGIGGCWIQSSGPRELPQFQAVEIGHLGVSFDGPSCYCGGIGCLEQVVGLDRTTLDNAQAQKFLTYALRSLALLFELDLVILGGPRVEDMSSSSFTAIQVALRPFVEIKRSDVIGTARAVGTAATVFQDDFVPCLTLLSHGSVRLEPTVSPRREKRQRIPW